MPDYRDTLRDIRTFPQLIKFLRDELAWPIDSDDFNEDELMFDYTPEELGIDAASAAKIQEIKRLRRFSATQPWGIFFIKFEPKQLPIAVLRRVLGRLVVKKRAAANSDERAAWQANDLLFVSNYGEGAERQISFAHFVQDGQKNDLPTLKVLGWDNRDTRLHLDHVADVLCERLAWPDNETDVENWRESWRSAFTLRHREVITTSKALAVRLAELARAIRDRIKTVLKIETKNGPVTKLMKAFQETLVHDLDADGFADMYAQTIAYGLLSARVTNPKANTADGFAAQLPTTNPFLKELMETFLHVGGRTGKAGRGSGIDFDELGVSEVVELLDDANMEAVVRDFGDRNPQEDPVIHFYELFLKEYDAKKRMQRGVFYTPRPVVSYIVRSVHELLQTKFGLADGLADTATWGEMVNRHAGLAIPDGLKITDRFVTILDPATGTGTFLVEAIEVIHRTLVKKWTREGYGEKKSLDLWNDYVPKHLLPRLHGYELLMAPYAIAHLKIGLKLHETGYRFESDERARIYLTNTLEPASDSKKQMEFKEWIPALAHEAEAVNGVKSHQRFTVVIGNPPYSGLSANMSDAASALIEPYKLIDGVHFGERKHWLHDDYVKFVRIGETTINAARVGVLGLITNHAFYDNPTFRGMRWNLLQSFGHVQLLDMHGNTMRREVNPNGGEDKNVFDIQQGVAISLFCKLPGKAGRVVMFGELWGTREQKYAALSVGDATAVCCSRLTPAAEFYFFVPRSEDNASEYQRWPRLNEIFTVFSGGFITARDHFVIDFNRSTLIARIEDFAAAGVSDAAIRERYFSGMGSDKYPDGDTRGWAVPVARTKIRKDARWRDCVRTCLYRPFDVRWVYWADWMVDWPRPEVTGHLLNDGNLGLVFMRQAASGDAYSHFLVSRQPVDNRACYSNKGIMTLAPLYLHEEAEPQGGVLAFGGSGTRANFTPAFLQALYDALEQTTASRPTPEDIFHYAYAVFHSPSYRTRYAEFLKIDFPRLPLTSSLELFRELARLGGELVTLHLVEAPAQQALSARYDKAAKAWRYEIAKGQRLPVTLSFTGPNKPVVCKVGWSDNTVWIDAVKPKKDAADARVTGTVGFRSVPEEIWNFHIGGYQVCEKWLKDRKDRTLTADDIAHYHRIVIALYETIRIMREIDEVIDAHGGWPGAFASAAAPPEAKETMGSRTPQKAKKASARVDLQQPNLFG